MPPPPRLANLSVLLIVNVTYLAIVVVVVDSFAFLDTEECWFDYG